MQCRAQLTLSPPGHSSDSCTFVRALQNAGQLHAPHLREIRYVMRQSCKFLLSSSKIAAMQIALLFVAQLAMLKKGVRTSLHRKAREFSKAARHQKAPKLDSERVVCKREVRTSITATADEFAYAKASPARRSQAPAFSFVAGPGSNPNISTAAVAMLVAWNTAIGQVRAVVTQL